MARGRSTRTRKVKVAAKDLRIHPTAQRSLSKAGLRKVMDQLDLDAVGTVHAVEYTIDDCPGPWVVDGQHRIVALKELDLGDWQVDVIVHEDVRDDVGAHRLFVRLNTRTPVSSLDRFANELGARFPLVVAVNEIVVRHGFRITRQSGDGNFVAVEAAKRIYQWDDGITLDRALSIATEAQGHTAAAVEGKLLEGLAYVLHRSDGQLDEARLVKKLAQYPGGFNGLIGTARGMRHVWSMSVPRCVAQVIVDVYDRGRRTRTELQ